MSKEGTPKDTGKEPSDTTPTVPKNQIEFPSPTSIKASREEIHTENVVVSPPIPIRRSNPEKDK